MANETIVDHVRPPQMAVGLRILQRKTGIYVCNSILAAYFNIACRCIAYWLRLQFTLRDVCEPYNPV